jgi:hypothetical protein
MKTFRKGITLPAAQPPNSEDATSEYLIVFAIMGLFSLL